MDTRRDFLKKIGLLIGGALTANPIKDLTASLSEAPLTVTTSEIDIAMPYLLSRDSIAWAVNEVKRYGSEKLPLDYLQKLMGYGHSFEESLMKFGRMQLLNLQISQSEVEEAIDGYYDMQQNGWINPKVMNALKNKEVQLKALQTIDLPNGEEKWVLSKDEFRDLLLGDDKTLMQKKIQIFDQAKQNLDFQLEEIKAKKYTIKRSVADTKTMMNVKINFIAKSNNNFEIRAKAKSKSNKWIRAVARKRADSELNHGRHQYWQERYEDEVRTDYSHLEY